MAMGETGMGDMGDMGMAVPANSLPMGGGSGPFGFIAMGGMFTVFKVRSHLDGNGDPGWYGGPPSEQAREAAPAELARDGIAAPTPPAAG
jgi:hypothetical protein